MDDNKSVVIVGCGNIGSRHLQAIAKLENITAVDIVEPSKNSQMIAKSRLKEIDLNENLIINWHESLDNLKDESDFTIVATLAKERTKILDRLLELGHSRFLIEKVVCQSYNEYEHLIEKMTDFQAKGWVNTPRRYYQSYRQLKKIFNDSDLIYMSVTAGNEGLGSNAIHFIDLFTWFAGSNKIALNGDLLFNQILPNSRDPDYVEFIGTIIGSSNDNRSSVIISFLPEDQLPVIVTIIGSNNHVVINETKNELCFIKSREEYNIEFKTEFSSSLTTQIVQDIFKTDTCSLPTIQDSSSTHYELFKIFNTHITKMTNKKPSLCPIT